MRLPMGFSSSPALEVPPSSQALMVAIGLLDGIEITLVYTDRGEVRRMISARKATHHERHAYYQALNP